MKLVPMAVVLGATALVPLLGLDALGVKTVGAVPGGLPVLNLGVSREHWQPLLQPALLIGFMVFLISMSGAQALALKRAEKLHSNYELLGLGAANLGSALSGGFPVTGSISRSAVNFAAGANTQLASLITAGLLALARWAPPAGSRRCRCRRWPRRSSSPCSACSTPVHCAPPGATTAPTPPPCWPLPPACCCWAWKPAS
nr:SulP family inorganic anion transporter [Massilia sp. Se16.2.3]